jgi:hypothetical protein
MNKLKNFLRNVFINSGLIKELLLSLGGIIGGPLILAIPSGITGLITCSLFGFDIFKGEAMNQFSRVILNGFFIDIGLVFILCLVLCIFKALDFINDAWKNA